MLLHFPAKTAHATQLVSPYGHVAKITRSHDHVLFMQVTMTMVIRSWCNGEDDDATACHCLPTHPLRWVAMCGAWRPLTCFHGVHAGDDDDGDDAPGADGEEDDDIDDAAAAAAKQAKSAAAGKRGKGTAAREEATLASADALRQKKVDNTFAVDPLFHKMSALFDEGGAKGELAGSSDGIWCLI
jgi:hypothetical protein